MINALEILLADMDADCVDRQIAWAMKRKEALVEFKRSEDFTTNVRKDPWGTYAKMWDLCGGKTWFRVFNENNIEGICAFVRKNCKAIADKRNYTIKAKLEKKGVTSIENVEYTRTSDGFNGVFVFNEVSVEIRTIIAGGYNIQCLHQRTLVYVGGKKA